MKKFALLMLLGILISVVLAVPVWAEDEYIPVESITISNPPPISASGSGRGYRLKATILPENATDKSIVWSSSDESIATVDDGQVMYLSNGTVTITATTNDGNKKAECVFKINCISGNTANNKMNATYGYAHIDGDFSEWASVPYSDKMINLPGSSNVSGIENYAKVKSIWNENYVYFLFEATTVESSNLTSIIMFLDEDNSASGIYDSNDRMIMIVARDGQCRPVVGANNNDTSKFLNAHCVTNGSNWTMEVGLMWSNNVDIKSGNSISVEFVLANPSSTLKSLYWNSKVGEGTPWPFYTTKYYGDLFLSPGTPQKQLLKINKTWDTALVGTTTKLNAHVITNAHKDFDIVWSSSVPYVATVDQNGVVTALRAGNTTISASINNGIHSETRHCTFVVKANGDRVRNGKVESIYGNVSIDGVFDDWNNSKFSLLPVNLFSDKNNVDIENYARIKSKWNSYAVYFLVEATDTALDPNDLFEFYIDENNDKTTEFKADDRHTRVFVQSGKLDKSHDASNKDKSKAANYIGSAFQKTENGWLLEIGFEWTKTNSIYAGKVLGVEFIWENKLLDATKDKKLRWNVNTINGAVAPFLSTEDFGTMILLGNDTVTGVEIDKNNLSGTSVGNSTIIKAIVYPESAAVQTVRWSSSNESVATVDQNGRITGIGVGTADITATTVDGGYTATYTISVCGNGTHTGDTYISGSYPETCVTDGYTGNTYCYNCGEKLSAGSNITRDSSKHNYGDWVLNGNTATAKCILCPHKLTQSTTAITANVNGSTSTYALAFSADNNDSDEVTVTMISADGSHFDYYMDNVSLNDMLDKIAASGHNNVIIDMSTVSDGSDTLVINNITIPSNSLNKLNNNDELHVILTDGTVIFNETALQVISDTLSMTEGNGFTVEMSKVNGASDNDVIDYIKDNMNSPQMLKLTELSTDTDIDLLGAVELSVKHSDNSEIHDFGDDAITIVLDVDITQYDPNAIRFMYIRDNGYVEYYTPIISDGQVIVVVPHLSTYIWSYDKSLANPTYEPPIVDDPEHTEEDTAPENDFNFFDRFGNMFYIYSQQYTVTAEADAGGSISNEGSTTAMYIERVTYTITPDAGYEIESVFVDGVDIGAVSKYTFNFSDAPQSISATFRKLPWQNPFNDIYETDVFYDAVAYVAENDIMDGFTRNTFKPKASMKRAEFIMALGKLAGVDTSAYTDFDFAGYTDIDPDSEYAPYAAWAIENGITLGYGDGRFGSNDKITRVQALMMTARYAASLGLPVDALSTDAVIEWAADAGLYSADSDVSLDSNATRTDIAVMLYAVSVFSGISN